MPVEDWSSVTGAAVILTEEWDYPEPATTDSADGDSDETDEQTDEDAEDEDAAREREPSGDGAQRAVDDPAHEGGGSRRT